MRNPPIISVIIPTCRRPNTLARCLESLMNQSIGQHLMEILVLNDGGDAETDTVVNQFKNRYHVEIRSESFEKRGPAFLRNRAISMAEGKILFFLNDDTILTRDTLKEHLKTHSEQPGNAVRGNTRWHSDVVKTKFMYWIAQTNCFYYLITDVNNIGYEYFHTLDLSINRSWLEDNQFSLQFPTASFEDTELGYRLEKKGLRIIFNPNAISYHYHWYSVRQFMRRAEINGKSAQVLARLQPELYERVIGWYLKKSQWRRRARLANLFIRGRAKTADYWQTLYELHYVRGIRSEKG